MRKGTGSYKDEEKEGVRGKYSEVLGESKGERNENEEKRKLVRRNGRKGREGTGISKAGHYRSI
jgi:hypothetical protein